MYEQEIGGFMPNTQWSKLNRLQLGKYAEYFTKMEFASYGIDVFTTEVDDKGIDFVIKNKKGVFCEIQVKSLRNNGYAFMKQKTFDLSNNNLFLALLIFEENELPNIFLIPACAWKMESKLFVTRNYSTEHKSVPEYGINISDRNKPLLEEYRFDTVINSLV